MTRILFVCHGNICRSPMAEYVMKNLVKKAAMGHLFHIASAATSREEIGNPVYPPAQKKLAEHGISCTGHAARQLTSCDYADYDLLIGMDQANVHNMRPLGQQCGAGMLHHPAFAQHGVVSLHGDKGIFNGCARRLFLCMHYFHFV